MHTIRERAASTRRTDTMSAPEQLALDQAQPPGADPNIVSKSKFAEANGWSKPYVSKLTAEGRLVLTEDGKVLARESLARIAATTGAPERASAAVVPPQFRADRDRREFYDAENSRLDLEERTGKLMNRADVVSVVADVGVSLRARLEAWPDRLAPQIAALGGNESRIRALLAEHVEISLGELSRGFSKLANPPAET
jgi:hypothetical protein